MANDIKIKLIVDKKTGGVVVAGKELDSLGKKATVAGAKLRGATSSVQSLTAALGPLIATTALVSFFTDAARAAIEQEDAIQKLNATLAQNGEFTQEASKEIQEFAKELERTTKITEEEALAGFALARSFTATTEQARKLTAAAIDFGAGAKLNFEEALRRLGRSMTGSVADLQNFDKSLGKLTKSQLLAGDAIDIVAKKFKGLGAAELSESALAVKRLTDNVRDLKEGLGDQLLPSIKAFSGAFEEGIPTIKRWGTVIVGTIQFSVNSLLTGLKVLSNAGATGRSIVSGWIKFVKDVITSGFATAASESKKTQKIVGANLQKIVDDFKNSQKNNEKVFKSVAEAILGIEKDKQKKLTNEKDKGTKDRIEVGKQELAAKKKQLAEEILEVKRNLQLQNQELNVAKEERLLRLDRAIQDEKDLLVAAKDEEVLKEEEFQARFNEVQFRGRSDRTKIEQEGISDITKANEDFLRRSMQVNANVAAIGRSTIDSIANAIGQSTARAIIDAKNFKELFTSFWRQIKIQVIAQITAMIAKLIILKTIQSAVLGFSSFGGKGGGGGGASGLSSNTGAASGGITGVASGARIRKAAQGVRTEKAGLFLVGEGGEPETVVPDSKADGFAMGVQAGRSGRGGGSGGGRGGSSVVFEGGIHITVNASDPMTDPVQRREVVAAIAEELQEESREGILLSNRLNNLNENNAETSF